MKKIYRAAVIFIAAAVLLSISCFAAHSEALADELRSMNMFKGTEQGYELDTVPTRAQAAVMLVRLLGQDENAKAAYAKGEITHPYVDAAAEWIAPSVAYLHANGLTNGMGKNEKGEPLFGMQGTCSAQMYFTFLLRALGYTDSGALPDFTYATAVEFAKEKRIVEDYLLSESFTRDVMVAASYQTLSISVKDGSGLLLEKLIASGAIDAKAAEPTLKKMKLFEKINSLSSDEPSDSLDTVIELTVKVGAPLNITSTTCTQLQYIAGPQQQIAMTVISNDGTNDTKLGVWYKDGWAYMDDGTNKIKTKADDALTLMEDSGMTAPVQNSLLTYMFSDITSGTDTRGEYYDLKLSPRFLSELDQAVVDSLEANGLTAKYNGMDVRIHINDNGTIHSMDMTMDVTMSTEGTDIPLKVIYSITINATGDKVAITYPELSRFIEVQ